MRDASVGFQCPECIAEGQRGSRTARTSYGGRMPINVSATSLVLIGLNVAVWLAVTLTGRFTSPLYSLLALRSRGVCVEGDRYYPNVPDADVCRLVTPGEWYPGVSEGGYWQLLTSGFVHVDPIHLLFNCFFIYMIGPQLEALFGRLRFLAVYLVSLLSGSVLVYWLAGTTDSTLGASGAAYGMMAGLLVVMLRRRLDARQLLFLIVANTAITFLVPGISWQGHLGGFIGGALTAAVLVYAPAGPHRARYQGLGVAAIAVAIAVLVAVRTLTLV